MGRWAERAFSLDALKDAWLQVWANDAQDGVLSPGVERFSADADVGLGLMAEELAAVRYRPGALTEVSLQSGDKARILHVPTVRDRIVARSILKEVTPAVDPFLGPASFAYRPGLGVVDAVNAVALLRGEGLGWVLRADIRDCFPTLPVNVALHRFALVVPDDQMLAVLWAFAGRQVRRADGSLARLEGVPQGCPLSPLLANLVLVDIDDALMNEGFPVVRYGDDVVVATCDAADASAAREIAARTAERLGMSLSAEKTVVTSFEDGFTFLGEDFGPRYPPLLDGIRLEEPLERVLYVALQGSRVRISQGRLIVDSKEDVRVLDVAISQVSRIVCFGSVGVSAGTRSWALSSGVDVVFASRQGGYQGTMLSHEHRYRPARLRAQLAVVGTERALELGRAIVAAKISKQRVILQRFNRRQGHEAAREAVSQLDSLVGMLPDAASQQEVMGLEGAAAHFYFPCVGAFMPEPMRFSARSRRPPTDVPNAALSYLYTILLGECVTALHAAGLDPAIGVLHADDDNRPSLALDLMEEFRPLVVDQVVLECARQGRLRTTDGTRKEGSGIVLTKAGRQAIVDAYERRMLSQTRGALPGFSGTLRRHLYRQAQRLRAAIQDPTQSWTGLGWRL